jgi:hypothetical protein
MLPEFRIFANNPAGAGETAEMAYWESDQFIVEA